MWQRKIKTGITGKPTEFCLRPLHPSWYIYSPTTALLSKWKKGEHHYVAPAFITAGDQSWPWAAPFHSLGRISFSFWNYEKCQWAWLVLQNSVRSLRPQSSWDCFTHLWTLVSCAGPHTTPSALHFIISSWQWDSCFIYFTRKLRPYLFCFVL